MKPGVGEAVLLHGALHAALGLFDVLHRQEAKTAGGPLLDHVVGDVRGNAAIVGDVEDQTLPAVHQSHAVSLEKMTGGSLVAREGSINPHRFLGKLSWK